MKRIELHVHSFSLRFQFRYRSSSGYDVFSYIDEMADRGFTGVNVSANGVGYRDLCGTTAEHFAAVAQAVDRRGLRLELDTSDTSEENMRTMLGVAAACGADTLRTYTKYQGELSEVVAWTIRDLRAIGSMAADVGVVVVLENHEDFTGPVLARILESVDHPNVRALYDYGNSQMVGEDPLAALGAMAPFIARVHAKDHVLVHGPGGPVVQGVAFGRGRLPVGEITDHLYAAGVRRFCFENVWGYNAPLKCSPDALPASPSFEWVDRTHYLVGDDFPVEVALREERTAFDLGLNAFHAMLAARGYEVDV